MRPLPFCFVSASLLILMEGCLPVDRALSPCRAQTLKDAERYESQHIPEAQWQPKIEAEIRACIEKEKPK